MKFRLLIFGMFLSLWLFPQPGFAQTVTKPLYFHVDGADGDADEDMSRVAPTGGSASKVTISDGGSNVWIEYPVHPGNIVLNGTHVVVITISSVTGSPDVTAELAYYSGGRGGTYTALASKKINNVAAGTISFSIPKNTTIFAGDPLAVTISEDAGGGDSFDVEFDSASRQSRVELSSESYISIPLLQTYQAAFPNTTIPTAYNKGDTAYIRSYVDDPFGYSDIYSTTLIVIDPDATTVVNTALAPIFSAGVRNVYEYDYITGYPLGQYDYTLISDEGTEGTVSAQSTNSFYVYDKTRVKLSDLDGVGFDGHVALTWETSMEIDNLGFNVYRSYDKSDGYERINPAFIPGLGSNTQGGKYLFIDYLVENGQSYYYKVEDVENSGKKTLHRPVMVIPHEGGGTIQYLDQDYVRIASTNDIPDGQNTGEEVVYVEGDGTPETGLTILSGDENTMMIEIRPPDYQVVEVSTTVGSHHEIRMDGYGLTEREGYPRLPTRGYLLPIPMEGDISLVVLDTKTSKELLELNPYSIQPIPEEESSQPWDASLIGDNQIYNILTPGERKLFKKLGHNRKYNKRKNRKDRKSSLYPQDNLVIEQVFNDGGQSNLLLRFYPIKIRKKRQGWILQSVNSIRVRINIKGKKPTERKIQRSRKNQFSLAASRAMKIYVTDDGIKRLSYQELMDAGFDMDKDPRGVTLYAEGGEIPVYVQGEKDGSWDSGDFIEFYGEGNNSEYSDTMVYWLAYRKKRGPRIPSISSPPRGEVIASDFADVLHLEENQYYYANLPDGEGRDHWFWDFVFGGLQKDFSFTLEYPSSTGYRERILVNFQALTSDGGVDPDHHTRVYLNNNLIGDFYWDGPHDYQFIVEVDHDLFIEGENFLSIEEVADTVGLDFVYLDSFDVAYYRQYIASDNRLFFTTSEEGRVELSGFKEEEIVLYDISRPDSPLRLVGVEIESLGDEYSLSFGAAKGLRHYAAFGQSSFEHPSSEMDTPSALHSQSQGADYIIITHPDFLSTIQPLANHRAGKGLRVVTADVKDVYDEFSFGNLDPEAIRSFLTHAWFNWPKPSPQNVLLVGGGTVDPKDYRNLGSINFIPPYLIKSGSFQTASDNRYVAVEGEDNLPEMGVGRLPVWDSQTLQIIIDRIIQYETGPPLDGMENRICLVADDSEGGRGFEEDIDQLIQNRIPPGVSPNPVYLSQLGPEATRQEILHQFESGNLIIHYQGHGSIDHWASEKIFQQNDVNLLNNASKLPFVEAMTCLNGYFINPGQISLAEKLLYSETGGAVAVWASTGYGHDQAMKYLADRFLEEIYTKGNRSLGSAITRAKINFLQYGSFYDEIDTFTLFGDPALELK